MSVLNVSVEDLEGAVEITCSAGTGTTTVVIAAYCEGL